MANILDPNEDYNPKNGLRIVYTKLKEIINKVNILWANSPSPKIYKALLTQSGTDAPVAAVLVNTLSGTPIMSYEGVGDYYITLTGEFLSGKVILNGISGYASGQDIYISRLDDNTIRIITRDSFGIADDILLNSSITIEVYPS